MNIHKSQRFYPILIYEQRGAQAFRQSCRPFWLESGTCFMMKLLKEVFGKHMNRDREVYPKEACWYVSSSQSDVSRHVYHVSWHEHPNRLTIEPTINSPWCFFPWDPIQLKKKPAVPSWIISSRVVFCCTCCSLAAMYSLTLSRCQGVHFWVLSCGYSNIPKKDLNIPNPNLK